jgi:hypothetical protein
MLGSNRLGLVGLDPTPSGRCISDQEEIGTDARPSASLRKAPDPRLKFVGVKLDDPRPRSTLNSLSATVSACASCTFEKDRAIRVLPLFRLVGVPCIAAFWRVKSLLCHHSDRPKLCKHVGRLFCRCDFFDWSFVSFGFFAIRNIQEPSDEAGAALLHDLRILDLL